MEKERKTTRGEILAQGPKPSHPADPGREHGQNECEPQRAGGVEIQTVVLTGRSWGTFRSSEPHRSIESSQEGLSALESLRILRQCMHLSKIRLPRLFVAKQFFLEFEEHVIEGPGNL